MAENLEQHAEAIMTMESRVERIRDTMNQPPQSDEAKNTVRDLLAECQAQRKQMEAICMDVLDAGEEGETTFSRIAALLDLLEQLQENFLVWSAAPVGVAASPALSGATPRPSTGGSGGPRGFGSGAEEAMGGQAQPRIQSPSASHLGSSDAPPDMSSRKLQATGSDAGRRQKSEKKKKEKKSGKQRSSDDMGEVGFGGADAFGSGSVPPAPSAAGPADAFGSAASAWPEARSEDVGGAGAGAWGAASDAAGWPTSSPTQRSDHGGVGAERGGFDAGAWGQDSTAHGFDAGFGASFPDSSAQPGIAAAHSTSSAGFGSGGWGCAGATSAPPAAPAPPQATMPTAGEAGVGSPATRAAPPPMSRGGDSLGPACTGASGSGFGAFGEDFGSGSRPPHESPQEHGHNGTQSHLAPTSSQDAAGWGMARGGHGAGQQQMSLNLNLRFSRPHEARDILEDEDLFKEKLQRCLAQAVNIPQHRIQNIIVYEGS